MNDTRARAHALDFAGADHSSVAPIVAKFQGAVDDIGDDLHLTMRVERKAASRGHKVVTSNPQRAKMHVGRVMMVQ